MFNFDRSTNQSDKYSGARRLLFGIALVSPQTPDIGAYGKPFSVEDNLFPATIQTSDAKHLAAMNAMKAYFSRESQRKMASLKNCKPECFYLSVWQRGRSAVPLLIWRALLFLSCVGMVTYSLAVYASHDRIQYWPIFLTHWGLTLYLATTGFALFISVNCYLRGPFSAEDALPWYVKTYWILYNIAVPVAFVITIFYWKVLYGVDNDELSCWLDAVVHGLNSVTMAALLAGSAHPSRLLHLHHPLLFAMMYIFFSVAYYLLGGLDPKGNRYVYPVVDWSQPAPTTLVVLSTVALLIVAHVGTCLLAALRDAAAPRTPRVSEDTNGDQGDRNWKPIKAFEL